jgi:hypothetical protein
MNNKVEKGYCQCGCGGKTKVIKQNNTRYGWIKGELFKFIHGHNQRGLEGHSRGKFGDQSPNWKGGRRIEGGYVVVYNPSHGRADAYGRVREHIVVAEEMNGGPLQKGAIVHHIDGNKLNNNPANLMICRDRAHHCYLHLGKDRGNNGEV